MSQPKSADTVNAELDALRKANASLESRLKEEVATHACTKALLQDRSPQVAGDQALGLVSNFTERVEAERAHEEDEERYRDMVESVSDRVWELDADLRITSFKGGGGHWAEEWVGKYPWDMHKDIPEWRDLMETLKAHRSYRDFPLTVQLKDGTTHHSRSSGKPWKASRYRALAVL